MGWRSQVLRKDAKIELLKRIPLFSGCTKSELAQISLIADEIRRAHREDVDP